ncbi:MAG: twin-arginine translocase TatA/TatE family subunit, partial [Edaphobacter sp.]
MPSFQDSIVIFFIALLIFGPKKLPELARQLGKLMAEFRRASNEFRMQMEDELRISEQEEQQKKIAAMEAAAPAPALEGAVGTEVGTETETDYGSGDYGDGDYENGESHSISPVIEEPLEVHPHMLPPEEFEPLPIATSGDLSIMPPSTGLPVPNTPAYQAPVSQGPDSQATVSQAFDSIPHIADPEPSLNSPSSAETSVPSTDSYAEQQHPDRTPDRTHESLATES